MEKLKAVLKNKILVRSLIVLGVAAAGAAIPDDQVDTLANAVLTILSLLG